MNNAQWPTPTHYETLGIPETATQQEIKKAYRRLAQQYHPDRNRRKGAEAKFKEINEAYQVLSNSDRRQIYDFFLAQGRKAGASASSSAGAGAPPPPPHSSTASSGTKAKATPSPTPPPPTPVQPYRYLFFIRGVFVGGGAVAAVLVLAVMLYAASRKPPAAPVSRSIPAAEPLARGAKPASFSVGFDAVDLDKRRSRPPEGEVKPPEPTPAPPTPAQTVATVPTLAVLVPTPHVPEPIPLSPPVHLCGEWRGSFEWYGERVPFFMRLEQHGSEVKGYWTEGHRGVIWRANIRGSVNGSTVTFVRTYVGGRVGVATFVSEHSSCEFLRGIWEDQQGSGTWLATWDGGLTQAAINPKASWRSRRGPSRNDCSIGWRQTLLGERAPCGAPPPHSSAP